MYEDNELVVSPSDDQPFLPPARFQKLSEDGRVLIKLRAYADIDDQQLRDFGNPLRARFEVVPPPSGIIGHIRQLIEKSTSLTLAALTLYFYRIRQLAQLIEPDDRTDTIVVQFIPQRVQPGSTLRFTIDPTVKNPGPSHLYVFSWSTGSVSVTLNLGNVLNASTKATFAALARCTPYAGGYLEQIWGDRSFSIYAWDYWEIKVKANEPSVAYTLDGIYGLWYQEVWY